MTIIKLFDYISLKLSTLGYRISLISECLRLSRSKRVLPDNYYIEITVECVDISDYPFGVD